MNRIENTLVTTNPHQPHPSGLPTADDVLRFWFDEIDAKSWWVKDLSFDQLIQQRFGALLQAASRGELWAWRRTAQGRLAEVIVLDQFSRNAYRDTPQSFAQDPMALALAQEAVAAGADQALTTAQRPFLYMPYMHSESAMVHEQSIALFAASGNANMLDFAHKHKAIIDRFGRYPHRNSILGRASSAEEAQFLTQPGSGF